MENVLSQSDNQIRQRITLWEKYMNSLPLLTSLFLILALSMVFIFTIKPEPINQNKVILKSNPLATPTPKPSPILDIATESASAQE